MPFKHIIFRKIGENEDRNVEIKIKDDFVKNVTGCNVKLVEALERKYLLFHYDNEQISMAFEFNQLQEKEDRLYSTYFIGTYSNPKPILDVQLGCLINTTAINSSRSGLERENEKEPLILSKIKDKCKITISVLCQLILDEKDPKNEKIYTDILCQFLYKYRFYCSKESGEVVPDSIFEGKSEEISKTISNSTHLIFLLCLICD